MALFFGFRNPTLIYLKITNIKKSFLLFYKTLLFLLSKEYGYREWF